MCQPAAGVVIVVAVSGVLEGQVAGVQDIDRSAGEVVGVGKIGGLVGASGGFIIPL